MAEETKKKRKKPVTLGHRTMEALRKKGYGAVGLVQRSVQIPDRHRVFPCPSCHRRFTTPTLFDLFGIIDIVAVHPEAAGTLYLQVTDHTDASKRVTKCLESKYLLPLLQARNRVEVWAWKRPHGKVKIWQVRIIAFALDDCGLPRPVEKGLQPEGKVFVHGNVDGQEELFTESQQEEF